jgi:hypothetical protein
MKSDDWYAKHIEDYTSDELLEYNRWKPLCGAPCGGSENVTLVIFTNPGRYSTIPIHVACQECVDLVPLRLLQRANV